MRNSLDLSNLSDQANDLIAQKLQSGGTIRFTVSTRSMLPIISPGDSIIAQRCCAEHIRLGAIVLVRSGNIWLVHRLIARHIEAGRLHLVTKGDNCTAPDDLWSAEQICAIIIAVDRNGRITNLESERARRLGAAVAWSSRKQAQWAQSHPGIRFIAGAFMSVLARFVHRVLAR
jgi:hypothetical protein